MKKNCLYPKIEVDKGNINIILSKEVFPYDKLKEVETESIVDVNYDGDIIGVEIIGLKNQIGNTFIEKLPFKKPCEEKKPVYGMITYDISCDALYLFLTPEEDVISEHIGPRVEVPTLQKTIGVKIYLNKNGHICLIKVPSVSL